MAKRNILIVDDEEIMRESIKEAMVSSGYSVTVAEDGQAAKELLQKKDYHVVISDIKMPGLTGLDLLRYIKEVSPETLVILMTAFGTIESAIEAMRDGAFDYLTKPFSIDAIEVVLEKALNHLDLLQENRHLRSTLDDKFNPRHFVGEHPSMQLIFETIRKVAHSKATVLIKGESGTGKELVARSLHFLSARKNKPFIKVNCAALSTGLLESELFGHEKGSFTGAHSRKIGRFEMADGGTILLDEISEIDIALQAKLLRVLQEKQFERVGGTQVLDVDVRIIATTNRDLEKAVRDGKFREDLYFRLHVVPVIVPPLRKRMSDVPLLMDYFLSAYANENCKHIVGYEEGVLEKLMSYSWPGNVRELENTIERAVVLSSGELLLKEHFEIGELKTLATLRNDTTSEKQDIFNEEIVTLEEIERRYILHTLKQFSNNKTKAAQALDVSVRTLRNKLDLYRKKELLNY